VDQPALQTTLGGLAEGLLGGVGVRWWCETL
jgi:hypothetical protein